MSLRFVGGARRGALPRRAVFSAAIALSCAALLAGCSGNPTGREHHFDGEGPLSASSGEGGFAAEAVESGTRYFSFGAHLLCVHENGAEIALQRVTYQAKVEPLEVEFWLRTVNGDEVVMDGDEVASPYVPFYSANGRPPDYDGEREEYAGAHTRDVAGTRITQPCDEMQKVNTGFTELILTMQVDKRGAHIPGMTIEYEANGKQYALDTRWRMIACGTAVIPGEDDEYCRGEGA